MEGKIYKIGKAASAVATEAHQMEAGESGREPVDNSTPAHKIAR